MSKADSKHTPGPWKIHKRSWPMTITGNIHQITNDDRMPAAFIPAWDNPNEGEEDGTEEALANARLVAAAPEMFDLLKRISQSYPGYIPDFVEGIVKLIAKAEGRAQ